jgi:hypothetical protein
MANTALPGTYPPDQDPVLARAESKMAELLGSLPEIEHGDIVIRPFQLEVDRPLDGSSSGQSGIGIQLTLTGC